MEGTGYETRQTSKEHVIVMVSAWSRGIDPAQSNATTVVFQSKREVYRDYFCLKKFDVTSICLKTIPGQ